MATREGSFTNMLAGMSVGSYHYVETTADRYLRIQTYCSVRARWPEEMKGRRFVCSAWTAVGTKVGVTKCLVRVERVA